MHKHPERVQSFEPGFGEAHVLYPEANARRCTAALVVEVDPVGLVRAAAPGKHVRLPEDVVPWEPGGAPTARRGPRVGP